MSVMRGHSCVITGAARGLGFAIAASLRAAGGRLFLVDRTKEALEKVAAELGGPPNVVAITDDLSSSEAPSRIWTEIAARGGATVLVNNAGIQGPIGPAWRNDWFQWEDAIRVNLLAPVSLCREFVAHWKRPGFRGKIINLSGGGASGPRANFSAYATAKVGLVRFSETLAEETKPLGIDVNCIAPGAMNSPMLAAVRSVGPDVAGIGEFEIAKSLEDGTPDVIERAAALCAFLASPKSDGITGKLLSAVWDPWDQLGEHLPDLQGRCLYTAADRSRGPPPAVG